MGKATPGWLIAPDRLYFIAEAGVNHNGELEKAIALIDVAARAGADAIKFQTFKTDSLVTKSAKKAAYQIRNDGAETSQSEMLAALELAPEDWGKIQRHCEETGVAFLSTPFDFESADLLEEMGVNAFKVSSGDLTYVQFLAYLARKNLPMIISTGMGNMAEVEQAVTTVEQNGNPPLAILHCVSNYPCDPADSNLRAMDTIAQAFGRPVGWSDHTAGDTIGLASVAAGARLIEKHFTLDRNLPGPDHKASLEPDELVEFIANVRMIESAMGTGRKKPTEAELDTAAVARRSVVLLTEASSGTTLTEENCGIRRPGNGLPPNMLETLLGRQIKSDFPEGHVLSLNDLA